MASPEDGDSGDFGGVDKPGDELISRELAAITPRSYHRQQQSRTTPRNTSKFLQIVIQVEKNNKRKEGCRSWPIVCSETSEVVGRSTVHVARADVAITSKR